MIKCKQAMENSACGKDCCCLECEEKETCKDVCSDLSPDCGDAVTDETALATMKQESAAVIKVIAELTLQKKQIEDQEKAMVKVANGNATKIIVPSELQNLATVGTTINEMIDRSKK